MLKTENAYRTITEVAELLQVPASVLRFWETQFHQIKPIKRMGRRYYQAEDVVLLARIRDYLYNFRQILNHVCRKLSLNNHDCRIHFVFSSLSSTYVENVTRKSKTCSSPVLKL